MFLIYYVLFIVVQTQYLECILYGRSTREMSCLLRCREGLAIDIGGRVTEQGAWGGVAKIQPVAMAYSRPG